MNDEIELIIGQEVMIRTDDAYKEKVDQNNIWVDYKNIVTVVEPGKHIFIDDGLLSLVVKDIGQGLKITD